MVPNFYYQKSGTRLFITPITMGYSRYNELVHGGYKPRNISGGAHHLVHPCTRFIYDYWSLSLQPRGYPLFGGSYLSGSLWQGAAQGVFLGSSFSKKKAVGSIQTRLQPVFSGDFSAKRKALSTENDI